jgi:hypothetical protein
VADDRRRAEPYDRERAEGHGAPGAHARAAEVSKGGVNLYWGCTVFSFLTLANTENNGSGANGFFNPSHDTLHADSIRFPVEHCWFSVRRKSCFIAAEPSTCGGIDAIRSTWQRHGSSRR